MPICKECIHNEMCYATHTDESPACCDYKAVQRWIPVTERLPEQSGQYLVRSYNGVFEVLNYSARHKAFNADDMFMYAECAIPCTHWMPLPEPPKEDAE